ncbi:hypothetical protein Pfo_027527 [Paulownia fortunei]|nr:hypothetical protein Pfo_027527 [Paulownia fortunei]
MAPRRRRSKVGLTRMHAALDAMRPMGFSSDVVRKCVKNLLKVYGDDGWVFIEEAAYKLLIDTILEEPEVAQLEHEPEHPLLEGGSHGSYEQPESIDELCDTEVIFEEQVCAPDIHEPEIHGDDINIGQEKSQEQGMDVEVNPMLLQDVNPRRQVGVQSGFALAYTPNLQTVFRQTAGANHVMDGLVMMRTMI